MYYLQTKASFDAAHFLWKYEGKCRNIHGHRWNVVAKIKSQELEQEGQTRGMVVDFGNLKKDLKVLCDYFGLKYTEPRERRSPSSRWAFSMKIYTPMMSRGYPEMFIDYIEKQGLDYHDFMKSRFITGYEKALQKENEEKNEVLCQRKIKEVVKKFADQVEPTTRPVDKKQIQQAMIDELAKTTIEGVGGETMPLKFSESKAKTLFNSMVKDNLHKQ